jgi:hypothetical protein
LGLTAISIILGVPALILRHEKRLLAKMERGIGCDSGHAS